MLLCAVEIAVSTPFHGGLAVLVGIFQKYSIMYQRNFGLRSLNLLNLKNLRTSTKRKFKLHQRKCDHGFYQKAQIIGANF